MKSHSSTAAPTLPDPKPAPLPLRRLPDSNQAPLDGTMQGPSPTKTFTLSAILHWSCRIPSQRTQPHTHSNTRSS
ncbi:hypothetical protein XENTR_v10014266 [Xenopus tropicalis]|nr:hypothetical protein XENTR_v10014266 [Xenopus tropicalis]